MSYLIRFERDNMIFLVSGALNHEIKIWNPQLAQNELITTLVGHFGCIMSLVYYQDTLISGGKDKQIKVWDLNELKCVQTLNQEDPVNQLCSVDNVPNKKLIISSCGDGFRIWNHVDSEYKLKQYNNKAHRKGISALCSTGIEDVQIATAGNDGIIKLWNVEKGICTSILKGHENIVYGFSVFPSKRLLFSVSIEGAIKVWNLKNGENVKTVQTEINYDEELEPYG